MPEPPIEPFAIRLYRRFLSGETPQQLARDTGIPLDRINTRLTAASRHQKRNRLHIEPGPQPART